MLLNENFYNFVKGTAPNLTYDFSKLDRVIDPLDAEGIKPLMGIGFTPQALGGADDEAKARLQAAGGRVLAAPGTGAVDAFVTRDPASNGKVAVLAWNDQAADTDLTPRLTNLPFKTAGRAPETQRRQCSRSISAVR